MSVSRRWKAKTEPVRVASLQLHPIKSCAGHPVGTFEVTPRGPAGDRRWMLVDEHGKFITAREEPALVRVRPGLTPHGLRVEAAGRRPIEVETPGAGAPTRAVTVWGDASTAGDAGDEAARWFGAVLGKPCRLVHQRDSDHRDIGAKAGAADGDEASFADGYPLLLIGTASLAALNERLARPVTMDRFRPNVVVETNTPFIEDSWEHITIGAVRFVGAKRCARCVLTTVDPETGRKDSAGEPLKTLRSFRFDRHARGILFGMNLIPRGSGAITVGDQVAID